MTKKRKKKERKQEIGTWPPPVSKLPILHDGVVIFVPVLFLGENIWFTLVLENLKTKG